MKRSIAFVRSWERGFLSTGTTPIGVFRDVERPVYDELMAEQLVRAVEKRCPGDLGALLHAGDTWTIE